MVQIDVASGLIQRGGFLPRPPSTVKRGQRALLLVLFVLTAGAWVLTIHPAQSTGGFAPGAMPSADANSASHDMRAMAMHEAGHVAAYGMAGGGWSLAGFAAFVVAWAVMMAAMMFPGVTPMLLLVHTVAVHRHGNSAALVPTATFAAGYLFVWTAVGAITWVVVRGLNGLVNLFGATEWAATTSPLAFGAVLLVAGLYQFTPLKHVCLDHCRSPFIFVMQRWREGQAGALRMGIGHGLYCFGCCWALFTVLVAAGVMSLAWMLALTLIDFAEKVLPGRRRVSQAVGVAFLVLGVGVATGLLDLPWRA